VKNVKKWDLKLPNWIKFLAYENNFLFCTGFGFYDSIINTQNYLYYLKKKKKKKTTPLWGVGGVLWLNSRPTCYYQDILPLI